MKINICLTPAVMQGQVRERCYEEREGKRKRIAIHVARIVCACRIVNGKVSGVFVFEMEKNGVRLCEDCASRFHVMCIFYSI